MPKKAKSKSTIRPKKWKTFCMFILNCLDRYVLWGGDKYHYRFIEFIYL